MGVAATAVTAVSVAIAAAAVAVAVTVNNAVDLHDLGAGGHRLPLRVAGDRVLKGISRRKIIKLRNVGNFAISISVPNMYLFNGERLFDNVFNVHY